MKSPNVGVLIVTHTLLSLLLFAGVIAIVVFVARRPLRRYKYVDLQIFENLPALIPGRGQTISCRLSHF